MIFDQAKSLKSHLKNCMACTLDDNKPCVCINVVLTVDSATCNNIIVLHHYV